MRFVVDSIAPAARRMVGDIFGKDAGDGWGVVVGCELVIAINCLRVLVIWKKTWDE